MPTWKSVRQKAAALQAAQESDAPPGFLPGSLGSSGPCPAAPVPAGCGGGESASAGHTRQRPLGWRRSGDSPQAPSSCPPGGASAVGAPCLLEEAVREGHLFNVQALLRDRADPNSQSSDGVPVVRLAAERDDVDALALLLGFSGDPAQARSPAASRKVHLLCDVFQEKGAKDFSHKDVLRCLDPGALAQAKKFLRLPGAAALGGSNPLATIQRPLKVVQLGEVGDHKICVHSSDSLRPVLDLTPLDGPVSSVLVLLHGVFQSGPMLRHLASDLAAELPGTRILVPTAPTIKTWGVVGPSWFDYTAQPDQQMEVADNIKAEVLELLSLQGQEGIGPDKVVLGGFSLGAAMAAWIALRLPCRVAGLLMLGTEASAVIAGEVEDGGGLRRHRTNPAGTEGLGVLQLHGACDALVKVADAERGAERLRGLGCAVEFEAEEGAGHVITKPMMVRTRDWLARGLPPV